MARGVTLGKLLNDLRAEARISLNVAHNAQHREAQVHMLQRKQEWFWQDFDWPHMRVERFLETAAGQRFYDMPEDLDIERIQKVEFRADEVYHPLMWGIDAEHYAAWDSELDQRTWPPRRVKITEDEQLEIWPISDTDFNPVSLESRIKITGIRNLRPLVAEDDVADIDDRLLVLHCAAEMLAASGAKDAQIKIDQATALYAKLRGNLMPRKKFRMFGVGRQDRPERVPLAIYKKV
jgi:hypothetical protein